MMYRSWVKTSVPERLTELPDSSDSDVHFEHAQDHFQVSEGEQNPCEGLRASEEVQALGFFYCQVLNM